VILLKQICKSQSGLGDISRKGKWVQGESNLMNDHPDKHFYFIIWEIVH